jgi:hypothetical protein
MSEQEPKRRRSDKVREDISAGLTTVFFIVGSLLNLLALVLLFGNIISMIRGWMAGDPLTVGVELLAPFGAFLAGVICYLIANSLD